MKTNYLWKKFSLMLAFVLAFSYSAMACNYQLKMLDSYGDGWNGGKVTVYVNGTAVLTNQTVSSGFGPIYATFAASTGDSITTDYTAGSWSTENSYFILDANGATIASQGVSGTPGDITIPLIAACPVALDASITEIIVPAISGIRTVKAIISNPGLTTLTSVTVNWIVDGTAQTAVAYTGSIASALTDTVVLGTYTFSTGSHSIVAASTAPNGGTDGNIANDTAFFSAGFTGVIDSFPHYEYFSGANSFWPLNSAAQSGATITTTNGNPGGAIHLTGKTSSSWSSYSNVTQAFANTSHIAQSVANVDATSLSAIVFAFDMRQSYTYTTNYNWFRVMINGTTYAKDINGDSVWKANTANADPYQYLEFNLNAYAGTLFSITLESAAKYNAATYGAYGDDTYIDNIEIHLPLTNDIQMLEWSSPISGSAPNTAMPITVKFVNLGIDTQDTIPLKYSIDGGTTIISEMYYDSIAYEDTVTYTFTTTANMGTPGYYFCGAVVANPGDQRTSNDTAFANPYLCTTLSGTYTIGSDTSYDFTSFSGAAFALNQCGVSGPVTFMVDSGTFDENVSFNAIVGASATNTITFKGLGNQTVITNSSAVYGNSYIFNFNGAKFFVLDSLTIQRHASTTYFWGVHFMNQADSNTVQNCTIDCGTGTSTNLDGIIASNSLTSYYSYGNTANGLLIDNNTIIGGYYGVSLRGTSTSTLCVDNSVTNNTFTNQYYYPVYFYYQDGGVIAGNTFTSGSQTSNYATAIYAGYGKNDLLIARNTVDMNKASYALYLFRHNYYTPNQDTAMVINNSFHVDRTSTGYGYGIYHNYSKNVKYYYNSVNITGNYTSSRAMFIYSTSSTGIIMKNNIFANNANGYAIYSTSSAASYENDYNNLYTSGSNFCYQSGAKADLTAWQTATSDAANSVSIDPSFFSNGELRTFSIPMNNKGTFIAGITNDIIGNARSATTPDVGCYEYTPPNYDMAVIAWESPLTGISASTSVAVTVRVVNYGVLTQSNIPVKYSIDGGSTFTTGTIAGPMASGDSLSYTFTTNANFGTFGNYNCLSFTDLTTEQNHLNDTIFYDVFACTPMTGAYTLGLDSADDFASFATLNSALSSCGLGGPITVYVDSGLFDENVTFGAIAGASATNTITIKGLGDQTVITNSSAVYGNSYIFNFNGAKFFVLDSLTIQRHASVSYFWGVHFMNQADSNTVQNCTIDCGTGTSSSLDGIIASNSLTSYSYGGNNANGLLIDNNTIIGGYYGVSLRGTSTSTLCVDNSVTNNTFTNQYYYPVYFFYQDGGVIAGNTFTSGSQTSNYATAIYAGYGKNDLLIARNTVDMNMGSYGLYLYRHNYYTPNQDTAMVINNSFHVDRTSTGYGYGIYHNYSKNVKYYYNSVNITGNYTSSRAMYINSTLSTGIIMKNNIFANNANGYVIYSTSSATNYENNYNMLYGSGSNFCYQGGAKADLTAWQTATSDAANSVEANPYFFANGDLRTIAINNYGTSLVAVPMDIDGTTRSATTPDIGAYEYDLPTVADLGADTTVCIGDTVMFTANVATDYTGFEYVWVNGATNDTLTYNTQTITTDTVGTYVVHVNHLSGYTLSDTVVFANYALITASFTGLDSAYCTNDAMAALVGTPANGVFSGNGVMGSTFDPMTAGIGVHVVTYDYTDSTTMCSASAMDTTIVFNSPVPVMSADATICEGDSLTISAAPATVVAGVFFSEYIEGSSNNKAIEIYNGTNDTIQLDEYSVMTNYNGNPWSGQYFFPAGATLAAGDVFVIANIAADPAILAVADDSLAYNAGGYVVGFNGDDVRALYHKTSATDSAMIDIIGRYDMVDPGSGWDVAGVSNATKDHSLIRKSSVMAGDTSWNANAGVDSLTSKYLVYPKNTFMYLGSHNAMPPVGNNDTYLWSTGATTSSITVMPNTTTTYTVVVDNGNCQETDSVVITVNPLPIVNLGADTSFKWTWESITLDAGNPNATWTWSTGGTAQTELLDSSILVKGANTVYVDVTENGCSASDTVVITVIDDVSINGAINNMNVVVYPNPTKGQFNMTINGFEGNLEMNIVDLAGQIVHAEKMSVTGSYTSKFDMSKLASGVYYIKLISNGGVKVEKLIIQ